MADIRITPASSSMAFTSSLNFKETLTQDPSGSLVLQGSGSTGRTNLFAVDGNNGRLFSIDDDLSDSLFSVNTIAGLPVIEAFADNTVVMGQYGQNVLVVTGSSVGVGTATPNSKLQVVGNTSITGSLNVSAGITGSLQGTATTASNITPAITNNTNNYVLTAMGTGNINGESTLTYDGSVLITSGYMSASRIYPHASNGTYFVGDTGGIVVNGSGYFYASSAGGSYFQNPVRFRSTIEDDTNAQLQIDGGTSGITYINGTLGVSVSAPTANIDTNGSIASDGGLNNTSTRPAVSAGTMTNGEIRGYSDSSPLSDDGFIRVSAGGGTNANQKTYIDLSGYSTVSDMNKNIVFGVKGSEIVRVTELGTNMTGSLNVSGNANITGSLTVTGSLVVNQTATTQSLNTSTRQLWGGGLYYTASLDWNLRNLRDRVGNPALRWSERQTVDSNNAMSIDWESRRLYTPNIYEILNWENELYLNSDVYQRDYKSANLQDAVSSYTYPNTAYFGDIIEANLDSTVTDGMLVYLDAGGTWFPVDQATIGATNLLGLAHNVNQSPEMVLLEGHVVVDDLSSFVANPGAPAAVSASYGGPIYIEDSTTTGKMSTIKPTTTGGPNIVRVLGHCYLQNSTEPFQWMMKFRPSNDWLEI